MGGIAWYSVKGNSRRSIVEKRVKMGHNRKLTALDGNHPNSTNPYRGDQVNFIVHQQEPITSDRLLASTKPHPQPHPPPPSHGDRQ